ncbi:hypothetical protein O181_006344 [Austropuccinia psidii MF-1]|uniref:Reverse transcriptase domain-containing protein n=1 Tax=Austropuccinia psidii MF-1 TaxID=1389203 RepID=A0A9Q3GGS9_9BASI|nr:hypothetical protein [Austropuccinia psidii MF-1]
MPFGIKNAPAHFQSMIDTIFQEEILEVWMVVYINDIIIYSETWEEHVQYINRLLRHKVSGLSVAIDQNKVAEVLRKPVPKNIKEIQSFLWLSSYYRNHIKYFAHITSNLYNLFPKDVVFKITKERRDEYERIKHEIPNAPVLILPDFKLPLKLYIDAACSQGLGAALHERQIVDGEPRERVIFYISRKLKDSESRYGAAQNECLFLVWALEKFHYYLKGAVFEVYTDCTALKSSLNIMTTNRHMLKFQIAIQENSGNIIIIYKEGKSHTNADGHWIMSKATQLMTLN